MVYRNPMMDKPAVLIVDDEDGIRKTLTVILNENDYDADSAKNGQEAIMKANEKFYNIALIDIVLPDMNGVELLTKIRETKPKMRKIIMTGNPSVQNAVGALNNGADAYIMKPLHIEKMLTTVEEQLKKQREERETAIQHFERGRLRGRIDVLGRESQALDI